jgi:hypothetical protein
MATSPKMALTVDSDRSANRFHPSLTAPADDLGTLRPAQQALP